MSDNLFEILTAAFPRDGSAVAIEADDGRSFTYDDLRRASGRVAGLLHDLGVRKGDRVAAQIEKSPEAVMLYLGCLRAGGAYLPLNTAYQADELAYFLGDAEPKVAVCDPAAEERFVALAERLAGDIQVLTLGRAGDGTLMEGTGDRDDGFPCVAAAADDLAAILYTSGTTGRSKGAMLSHRNLASNAQALHRIWGFRDGDVLLHALPIYHTHGLFVATNCALLNGSRMIWMAKFDSARAIAALPRATVMMGVPTFYTRLLADPAFGPACCRNMRLFISGSAPLLADTFEAFRARCGHSILERYGMTETGMNTSNPLDGERIAGTVGFPLPEVEVRVADGDGRVLPAGEVGILEVRGPNVFGGYWRNPEKTAEEFRPDGFFITGDMSRVDARGYVHIVGRSKDLVISGGLNVYPKEIELLIDDLDGVDESAVIGLPHPDFGEAVAAVVKPAAGGEPPTEAAIIAAVKRQAAGFKVPKAVFFVDELPRNAMGKVQKNLLRERHRDSFAAASQP